MLQWAMPYDFLTTTESRAAANESTVRAIYVAFGGGDVPAFLATLADDVRWESDWEDNWAQHDDGPPHFQVTVTFKERDGKTTLIMRSVFPTAAARDHVIKEYGAIEGGKQTLARFAEHLRTVTGA